MRDETLIEPFAAQEIYCDGFTDFKVRNGNMSCVGFRVQEPERDGAAPLKIVMVRLIFPRECAPAAIAEAQSALTGGAPVPENGTWLRRAH